MKIFLSLLVCLTTFVTLSWGQFLFNLGRESKKSWPTPPAYQHKAKMARYLAHYADWGIVSTLSTDYGLTPFGILQSFSDRKLGNSTGTPYFYMSVMSDVWRNLEQNDTASLALTQAESDWCESHELDPLEPICSRATYVGKIIEVTDDAELKFAKAALFARHPAMKEWPAGHGWKVSKLVISGVNLVDFYGGSAHISADEYFAAQPPRPQHWV